MKFTIKYLFFLIVSSILFTGIVSAQNADKKTQTLIQAVKKKYNSIPSFQIEFSLKSEYQQSNITETETGSMKQSGDKFYIVQKNREICNNTTTQWLYDKESNEIQITKVEQIKKEEILTPNQIFKIFEKQFLSILFADDIVNKLNCKVVDMTPIDKEVDYYKIRVWINPKDNSIQQLRMYNKNGERFTCTITKFSVIKILDNQFNFDTKKYPKAEIVDLR